MKGLTIAIVGGIMIMVGFFLTMTIIGAIIGIPLFVVGVILLIKGRLKYSYELREKYKKEG